MRRLGLTILVVMVLLGISPAPVFATDEACEPEPVGQETKEVIPGITLTWDSSFLCEDCSDTGSYNITVKITNAVNSTEAVRITDLRLSHTTPRPRGRSPDASAEVDGLPLTLEPGENGTFNVTGIYKLVATDEGKKANLHLRAYGQGATSEKRFRMGINVHLRSSDAVEGDEGNGGGPPPWAGGPPSWVNAPSSSPGGPSSSAGGPPPWAGGPPPWAGGPPSWVPRR